PLFDKFRAVTMAHYIPQFVMAIGAAFTLQAVLEAEKSQALLRKLYIAAGVVGGLALLFWLAPGMAGSFEGPMDARMLSSVQDAGQRQAFADILYEDRQGMASSDALRSLIFILLAAGTLFLTINKTIKPMVGGIIIGALVLFDLGGVDMRYLNKDNFGRKLMQRKFNPTAANQAILQDKDPYFRVINLLNPWNDGVTPYFHKTIGGYSPAKMQRYQEIIERGLGPETQRLITALQGGNYSPDVLRNLPVHNMLNTKYFIAGEAANAVLPNPHTLGNAWFVTDVKYVNGPDAEIAAITGPGFDPATTAIVDQDKFQVSATRFDSTGGTIKLTDYTPTSVSYQTSNSKDGLAVLSEVYYPKGWKVELDGQEIAPEKLIRVNYILRAIEVPAGQHTLRLSFEPQSYSRGVLIARIMTVLMVLLVLGAGFQMFRQYKANADIAED
ncbi:MAG: YfhO family protein, partial [Bacteroidota bacterium]